MAAPVLDCAARTWRTDCIEGGLVSGDGPDPWR